MKFFQNNRRAIIGTAACLLIGGITLSFQDSPMNNLNPYNQQVPKADTIPDKKCCDGDKMTMKEFERLPETIDREVSRAMEEVKKIDWAGIEKQIKDALKNVDVDKISADVQKSLKDIDFGKMADELSRSMKDVDWDKINKEIKDAMEDVKKELDGVKMDDLKKELDNAKVEIEKSKDEFKKIDMPQIMKEAKEGIEQAKAELRNIKLMFDEMEKDGLINKKAGFSVEYKDKVLYINGKKQTEQVTEKYRNYFKNEHFKMTIISDKEREVEI